MQQRTKYGVIIILALFLIIINLPQKQSLGIETKQQITDSSINLAGENKVEGTLNLIGEKIWPGQPLWGLAFLALVSFIAFYWINSRLR